MTTGQDVFRHTISLLFISCVVVNGLMRLAVCQQTRPQRIGTRHAAAARSPRTSLSSGAPHRRAGRTRPRRPPSQPPCGRPVTAPSCRTTTTGEGRCGPAGAAHRVVGRAPVPAVTAAPGYVRCASPPTASVVHAKPRGGFVAAAGATAPVGFAYAAACAAAPLGQPQPPKRRSPSPRSRAVQEGTNTLLPSLTLRLHTSYRPPRTTSLVLRRLV